MEFGSTVNMLRYLQHDFEEEIKLEAYTILDEKGEELFSWSEEHRNATRRKQDLARNLARISPTGVFQFAVENVADSGLKRQRRFEQAAKNYYHAVLSLQEREGPTFKSPYLVFGPLTVKVDGETVNVPLPYSPVTVPDGDISGYPRFSFPKTSLGENFSNGLWDTIILLLWNLMLALLAPLMFLRYDVK